LNLTLSLLAGLALLLPGLSALAAWNFKGAAEGASGAELPLTSVSGLFVVMGISAILHLAGYWITYLAWGSAPVVTASWPGPKLPMAASPYETLWSLISSSSKASEIGKAPVLKVEAMAEFGLIILVECIFAVRAASSRLFDLVLDGRDMRGLGWVYQNIIRPRRNGYQPFAFVLTTPTQGEYGLGYEGMVAEIRQGADGQLKSICLSEPEAFVYEIKTGKADASMKVLKSSGEARVRRHRRRWLGGVVALEANVIRNIVIHHISTFALDRLEEEAAASGADHPT
jgi:hypothetical protein